VANRQEVRGQQAGDVTRQHQHLGVAGVPRDAGLEDAQRDDRVGGLARRTAQEFDARQEAPRQRQEVRRRRFRLGGGDQQAAQLGVVAGLSREDGRASAPPRRSAPRAGRRRPC
jgi:hypothetical protein